MSTDLRVPVGHEREVYRTAVGLYEFLKRTMDDLKGADAHINRDRLTLIAEAYKSRYFMDLLERDQDLDLDVKMKLATAVSGMNKTWPAVQAIIRDPVVEKFAAVFWKMMQMGDEVLAALEISVVEDASFREILPEELPPP